VGATSRRPNFAEARDPETGDVQGTSGHCPKGGTRSTPGPTKNAVEHGGAGILVSAPLRSELNLLYLAHRQRQARMAGQSREATISIPLRGGPHPDTGKMVWYFQYSPHDTTIGTRRRTRCSSMPQDGKPQAAGARLSRRPVLRPRRTDGKKHPHRSFHGRSQLVKGIAPTASPSATP